MLVPLSKACFKVSSPLFTATVSDGGATVEYDEKDVFKNSLVLAFKIAAATIFVRHNFGEKFLCPTNLYEASIIPAKTCIPAASGKSKSPLSELPSKKAVFLYLYAKFPEAEFFMQKR